MSRLLSVRDAQRATRTERNPEGSEQSASASMDRGIAAPLIPRKPLMTGLMLVLVLTITAYAYITFGLTPTRIQNLGALTTSEVQRKTYSDYIPLTGQLVPRNIVYLDAVEGGQVTEVFVDEGEVVYAGQALLSLKNTNLQLEVINTEAQLMEQVNNLNMTRLSYEQNRLKNKRDLIDINYRVDLLGRTLERLQRLKDTGATTRQELEDMQAQYRYETQLREAVEEAQEIEQEYQRTQISQLEVSVENMQKNIAIAHENLESLTVRSPIGGQITVLDAKQGESKARGQRLGQVDEAGAFKISALVDEFYLSRVLIGQQALAEIDGADYLLTVDKVYPQVSERQFEIDLQFDSAPPSTLRRGQSVRLRLEIGDSATGLVIDNGPFFDSGRGQWVFVVDREAGIALRRNVQLGRRNPEDIEVISGLEEGETVIVSSYAEFDSTERLLLNK